MQVLLNQRRPIAERWREADNNRQDHPGDLQAPDHVLQQRGNLKQTKMG